MKIMTIEEMQLASTSLRHILSFQIIPGNEELRRVADAALRRPFFISGYRFIGQSPDSLSYLIEEVDVEETLQQTARPTPVQYPRRPRTPQVTVTLEDIDEYD